MAPRLGAPCAWRRSRRAVRGRAIGSARRMLPPPRYPVEFGLGVVCSGGTPMLTSRMRRALCWGAVLSTMVLLAGGAPAGPAEVAKPMLAHWSFDEAFGTRCADSGGGGYHALPVPGGGVVQRI